MATWRYKIPLLVLKNISLVSHSRNFTSLHGHLMSFIFLYSGTTQKTCLSKWTNAFWIDFPVNGLKGKGVVCSASPRGWFPSTNSIYIILLRELWRFGFISKIRWEVIVIQYKAKCVLACIANRFLNVSLKSKWQSF